jgi:Holliday junction resolvase RusA-like endonuclease
MNGLIFTVPGIAQPQGSARAFTYHRKPEKGGGIGARVDSDNPKLKAWRRDVGTAAQAALRLARGAILTGPVRVCADVYLPRPQSMRAERPHITRPDIDKIGRGLLDALTGVLFNDDGQVAQLKLTKAYAQPGTQPCVVVSVRAIDSPLFAAEEERKVQRESATL